MKDEITNEERLQRVLKAVRKGVKAIPLQPPIIGDSNSGKRPLIFNWVKKASCDVDQIKRWYSLYPDCNWGMLCGYKSRVIVVDIDEKNGGLVWYEEHKDKLKEGIIELTGGGGLHIKFYLPHGTTIKSRGGKVGIAKGVELLSDGRQVVTFGSKHFSGNYYEMLEEGTGPETVLEKKPLLPEEFVILANDKYEKNITSQGTPIEDGCISPADDEYLKEVLNSMDAGASRHEAVGTWICAACYLGMSKEVCVDLAKVWLRDKGRHEGEQPEEIENWWESATRYKSQGILYCPLPRRPSAEEFDTPKEEAKIVEEEEESDYFKLVEDPLKDIELSEGFNNNSGLLNIQSKLASIDEATSPSSMFHEILDTRECETNAKLLLHMPPFKINGHCTLRAWGGELYLYGYKNKGVYDKLPHQDMRSIITRMTKGMNLDPQAKNSIISTMYDLLYTTNLNPDYLVSGDPTNGRFINYRNGILDTVEWIKGSRKKAFYQKHNHKLFSLSQKEFNFDPSAKAPLYEAITKKLFPETDQWELFMDTLAYMSSTDSRFQICSLFIGPSGSGKSVIANNLVHNIGQSNCCSSTMNQIGSAHGLEPVLGKRLMIIGDAKAARDAQRSLEILLSLIGNDLIGINPKNKTAFAAFLGVKIHLNMNAATFFGDNAAALPRRFRGFRIESTFDVTKPDINLPTKLRKELPGIENLYLAGMERYLERGSIPLSKSGKIINEDMNRENSVAYGFMKDRLTIKPKGYSTLNVLYDAFKQYCIIVGRTILSKDHFLTQIKTHVAGARTFMSPSGEAVMSHVELIPIVVDPIAAKEFN